MQILIHKFLYENKWKLIPSKEQIKTDSFKRTNFKRMKSESFEEHGKVNGTCFVAKNVICVAFGQILTSQALPASGRTCSWHPWGSPLSASCLGTCRFCTCCAAVAVAALCPSCCGSGWSPPGRAPLFSLLPGPSPAAPMLEGEHLNTKDSKRTMSELQNSPSSSYYAKKWRCLDMEAVWKIFIIFFVPDTQATGCDPQSHT